MWRASHCAASMHTESGTSVSDLIILGHPCRRHQLRFNLELKSARAGTAAAATVRSLEDKAPTGAGSGCQRQHQRPDLFWHVQWNPEIGHRQHHRHGDGDLQSHRLFAAQIVAVQHEAIGHPGIDSLHDAFFAVKALPLQSRRRQCRAVAKIVGVHFGSHHP